MPNLNSNLPYTLAKIRKEFTGLQEDVECIIFGVKAVLNKPLLFHCQTIFGAVIYQQPISAFYWGNTYDALSTDEERRLQILEIWNAQSSDVAVTQFSFLHLKRVDVLCRDRKWRTGKYLFTIDDYFADKNVIPVGYAEDVDSKCFHFIQLDCGNFGLYPNNLLRWHNPDHIVPYDKENPPKIKLANLELDCEDIDRSYGNSAYFFYNHEQ